jgi:diguanylate cyclase (GGDEF)-like protein/PAS domain S-box-containing protein
MIQPERQTREMHDPDHLLRVTLQSIRDGVVVTDEAGHILMLNAAAESMTGWSEAEAIGKPVETVVDLRENSPRENDSEHPLPNPAYKALRDAAKTESPAPALLIGKGGRRTAVQVSARPLNDAAENISGSLLIFHDIGEALRLAERRSYLAQHDPLTGLPNRILLIDRMEQATKFADRHSDQMAVISADLDHFDQTNTTYGQAVADQLLKEAAYRMAGVLRESDTVSRLGADDFVILLPGVKSTGDVENLALKLLAAFAQPFVLGEHIIQTSCSIGISFYPQDAIDAGTLMRLADGAMHQAKQSGRNKYIFARSEQAPTTHDSDLEVAG